MLHVLGLGIIENNLVPYFAPLIKNRYASVRFALIMGATTLFASILHGIEAAIWGLVYLSIDWCTAESETRDSLFVGCDDNLRTSQCLRGSELAPIGGNGGPQG
jgi:hypothetical protein